MRSALALAALFVATDALACGMRVRPVQVEKVAAVDLEDLFGEVDKAEEPVLADAPVDVPSEVVAEVPSANAPVIPEAVPVERELPVDATQAKIPRT